MIISKNKVNIYISKQEKVTHINLLKRMNDVIDKIII